MSEREADETAKFGEVQRWSTDSEGDEAPITQTLLFLNKTKEKMGKTNGETKGNTEFIGVKVARDFGKQGVFVGEIEIVALEYGSGDDAKEDLFYVVRYTDGDQGDFDGKELSHALELYHRTTKKNRMVAQRLLLRNVQVMKPMMEMRPYRAGQMTKKATFHRLRFRKIILDYFNHMSD